MVNNYPDSDGAGVASLPHCVTHRKQLVFPPSLVSDLQHVDSAMLDRVRSHSVLLNVAGQYVLTSGGKRLRAALVLLWAQLGDYELSKVIHAATTVELIHVASLVHDDLVDEAERRRGMTAVHAHWDHGVALMVGDYFFALASGEMALLPDRRVITYYSQAVMTICEGELAPVMEAIPLKQAVDQYYYKIGCKTASLFAAACKSGMASGGGSEEHIEIAGRFGYDLGLAFQIMDDILDFTGNEEALGKPAGSDLRNGVITLPFIYAVDAGEHDALLAAVDSQDETLLHWAVSEVRRLGIARAYEDARMVVARALQDLDLFPDGLARQTLIDIATFVLERDM